MKQSGTVFPEEFFPGAGEPLSLFEGKFHGLPESSDGIGTAEQHLILQHVIIHDALFPGGVDEGKIEVAVGTEINVGVAHGYGHELGEQGPAGVRDEHGHIGTGHGYLLHMIGRVPFRAFAAVEVQRGGEHEAERLYFPVEREQTGVVEEHGLGTPERLYAYADHAHVGGAFYLLHGVGGQRIHGGHAHEFSGILPDDGMKVVGGNVASSFILHFGHASDNDTDINAGLFHFFQKDKVKF